MADDTLPNRYNSNSLTTVDIHGYCLTHDLEEQFIRDNNLIPYTYKENYYGCVLYLKTRETYYEWPGSKTLTSQDLELFKNVGHTLGIDYTRTYARKFALNVDCLCRTTDASLASLVTTRANDEILPNILTKISAAVKDLFPSTEVEYEVWRNNGGYHIYTNLQVSLPTHLHLTNQVAAEFLNSNMVIEVPNIMPLPYSTKISYQPNQLVFPSKQFLNLIMDYDTPYFEVYSYSSSLIDVPHSAIKAQTTKGILYLNYDNIPDRRCELPELTRVIHVEGNKNYMRQMLDYVEYIMSHQPQINETLDFSLLNPVIGEKLKTFMLKFNNDFGRHEYSTCDLFVKNSLVEDGGLYLQPYVVMLHKYLLPISDFEFKEVLKILYERELTCDDPCIKQFVRYYDKNTLDYYSDKWEVMMDHLCCLYTNQLSATMSSVDKFDKLLSNVLRENSLQISKESLSQMNDENKSQTSEKIFDIYFDTLAKLQYLMYDSRTSLYYYLFNGAHYETFNNVRERYAKVMDNWLGCRCEFEKYFDEKLKTDKFTVEQASLFCESNFQFATSVGTFNSFLGMYTAQTRFLRFNCYRDVAIWRLDVPCKMYTRQNCDVLERLRATEKYKKLMDDNVHLLFVHFLFAPAMMQLKALGTYEYGTDIIPNVMNLLQRYQDWSSAYFLVEYFPIDPKFIYLIMYIRNKYGGFHKLGTYSKIVSYIFKQMEPNTKMWQVRFQEVCETVTFEEKESHMDTLLTINGCMVGNVTEESCFHATMIAICVSRCSIYKSFVEAFKNPEIVLWQKSKTRLEYNDLKHDMNIENYRNNMHRAIKIVFGDDLSKEDKNIVVTMFAISMSTYFDPTVTSELLLSFSSLFAPREQEKIVVYDGYIGESLIKDIMLRMVRPEAPPLYDSKNRFHEVKLKGMPQRTDGKGMYSLLRMLLEKLVWKETIESTESDLTNAISFLGCVTFLLN